VCDDLPIVTSASARAECADLVAKRAAIELLQAADATVWADSFGVSRRQVDALAIAALTFAFSVTAAGWSIEEAVGPAGQPSVEQTTGAVVSEIIGRLTWIDDAHGAAASHDDPRPVIEEWTMPRPTAAGPYTLQTKGAR